MAKSTIKAYAHDYFLNMPDCINDGDLKNLHRWDIKENHKVKCLRCGFTIVGYYENDK